MFELEGVGWRRQKGHRQPTALALGAPVEVLLCSPINTRTPDQANVTTWLMFP